jgi:DNA-directed RNA polymerase subunit beta
MEFAKNPSSIQLPNLIQVQRASYEEFLQMDLLPEERTSGGLQAVLTTIFPFTDFRDTCELQFVRYDRQLELPLRPDQGPPPAADLRALGVLFKAGEAQENHVVGPHCGKANRNLIESCGVCGTSVGLRLPFNDDECRGKGMSHAVPVRLTFRLVTFDTGEDGNRQVRDVKEEELYFGELPLMTDTGTFIINGPSASLSPSCTGRRASSSPSRVPTITWRRSCPTADRGSSSSTTTSRSSGCGSTASAASRAPSSCAR